MMECFVVFLVIFVGIPVIRVLLENSQRRARLDELASKVKEGLKVQCKSDSIELDSGKKLPVIDVQVSGVCLVPADDTECRLVVRLLDIPDEDAGDRFPVFSLIPDVADDDGTFKFDTEVTVPYRVSSFEDLPVVRLIPEALVLPKKGRRHLRVFVEIVSAEDPTKRFQAGQGDVSWTQPTYGYMERARLESDARRLIARLAVAVCASDGFVDKRETAIIQRYFSERLAGNEDRDTEREEINQVLRETLDKVVTRDVDVIGFIEETCEAISEIGRPVISQSAFEMCVRIVAADQKVEEAEQTVLDRLAQQLEIPPSLAEEIRDRHFTIGMFAERSTEALLDIPGGLSDNEKIAFLNREYQKWRSRVTHKDSKIRAEAEMRLQAIAKLRRELSDA